MNHSDFELEMKVKYPNLYKHLGGDPKQTCMAWGLCIAPGWYDIINRLSEKLEDELLKIPGIKDDDYVGASQVKEKFGGLCFYMNGYNDEIEKLISEACEDARNTCEVCGDTGEIKCIDGWMQAVCEKCANGQD